MKKLWPMLITVFSLVVILGCSGVNLLLPRTTPAPMPTARATSLPAPTLSAVTPPTTRTDALDMLQETLEHIYQDVGPSVVNVQVVQKQEIGENPFHTFPGWPFEMPLPQQPPQEQYRRGSGSGFVWDREGHIVTNNHVVEGADKIKVTFSDGTTVPGTVVGTDQDSDLAVVQVDMPADALRPVQLADSTRVKVGQIAVAIGNPFGLENTMTVGFVSAVGRSLPTETVGQEPSYTIPDVIQTDAPINPGNSGGVLVDDQGAVIGVTSAIVSPVRASAGIGFAIPAAIVQKVVPPLIETGHYTYYPWLGISGTSLDADLAQAMDLEANQRGALVIEVVPGGPADEAGLHGSDRTITVDGIERQVGGDVIVGFDDQQVNTFDDLVAYLVNSAEVGQEVTLTILRDGREQQVEVTLGERPEKEGESGPTAENSPGEGAWLGINGIALVPEVAQAMNLPETQTGVLIIEVVSDSPADKAGLHGSYKPVTIRGYRALVGGDVIVAWDGQSITDMEDVQALVGEARVGQEVTLSVLRDGEQVDVRVTLEARPAP